MRQLTDPVGRIVRYVMEQLNVQSLNQASGGSCSALLTREKSGYVVLVSLSCYNQKEIQLVRTYVPTKEVSENVCVTNYHLKLVFGLVLVFVLVCDWGVGSVEVAPKSSFYPRVILVCPLNGRRRCFATRNAVRWPSLVEIWIRVGIFNPWQLLYNDVGCLFGPLYRKS